MSAPSRLNTPGKAYVRITWYLLSVKLSYWLGNCSRVLETLSSSSQYRLRSVVYFSMICVVALALRFIHHLRVFLYMLRTCTPGCTRRDRAATSECEVASADRQSLKSTRLWLPRTQNWTRGKRHSYNGCTESELWMYQIFCLSVHLACVQRPYE